MRILQYLSLRMKCFGSSDFPSVNGRCQAQGSHPVAMETDTHLRLIVQITHYVKVCTLVTEGN